MRMHYNIKDTTPKTKYVTDKISTFIFIFYFLLQFRNYEFNVLLPYYKQNHESCDLSFKFK